MYQTIHTLYCTICLHNFNHHTMGKNTKPIINITNFINDPLLVVIDCSKQNETMKVGTVDVRIEFEMPLDFPANSLRFV